MKYAIIYSYGFETDMRNKEEVEEIIRERELNISLINKENGCVEVRSTNYPHLWLLMFILSCKDEWVIY